MKVIGFNQGQYGDLCMCTVAARSVKEMMPNCELYFGINKKYESLKDIFLHNDFIDHIHIWDQYDGWPNQKDLDYITGENFNIVFDAMPKHTSDQWYLFKHQTEELCHMHKIVPPMNLQVSLNKYFETEDNKKYVAVNLFAETRGSDKTPSLERAKEICEIIKSHGFTPVQVGLPSQPQICEERFTGTFFESIKFVLSCNFLFTVDSAMSWIMSGYNFPTIGIYAYSYYPGATSSVNWQPINSNGIYIESDKISNITVDSIDDSIRSI